MKLSNQPSGNVAVAVASSDSTVATVDKASLDFTTTNWDTAQDVIVTGVDTTNTVDSPDRSTTITHSASGSNYASGVADVSVAVTATDNDRVLGVAITGPTTPQKGDLI